MEEKKKVKISLSTFFLVIVIIVIIIMGYFIYAMYIENLKSKESIEMLNYENDNLKNTINDLQTTIDSISNTINSKTNTKNIEFSNEEIKETLQNYMDLIGIKEGSPVALLKKLNLITSNDINNNNTNDGYVKTNIQYKEYKQILMNYVTEEVFNDKFTKGFKEQDGLLYYFDGGATAMQFEVDSIALDEGSTDEKYTAKVYNINVDGSKELNNVEFAIENYNGKCIISYCE